MTATDSKNPVLEQLKQIRASKTLALKPTPRLRQEIVGLDGKTQPLRLRYYQSQGIFHLLLVKRMVLGDGTGLGKTCQTIAYMCYLWDKSPEVKAIVICPKSAIRQWASEINRFAVGVNSYIAAGTLDERKAAYEAWAKAPSGPDDPKAVLITNYHSLVRDWDYGGKSEVEVAKPGAKGQGALKGGLLDSITSEVGKFITVFDECTAFKNPTTKTWQTCRFLSDKSDRVVGLTATLLKNNLMEGFGIYKVIKPDIFSSKTKFQEQFCVMEMQRVKGGVKVPVVVGYKNLTQFRTMIEPYFYGRNKHEVSNELPSLTTKEIVVELTPAEDKKYAEALSGVLELGDGEIKEYEDTKALTSLIYCQQCVDSPALLRYNEGDVIDVGDDVEEVKLGSKEQALLDLLDEQLEGEKVIVYTRFESLVGRLQKVLAKAKIKSVRITGKENDKKRAEAQNKFQDLSSDTKVVFITDAGSEAINLQAAAAIIFYDSPWSWGNYVQLLGRMIRIGSPYPSVFAIHLVAERPGKEGKKRETIDAAVLRTLRKKKVLIDQIIGEAAQGALKFDRAESGGLLDLLSEMRGGSV
jgi:SNF2 family DNA or RNA helicase